jgi:hypothetical protein
VALNQDGRVVAALRELPGYGEADDAATDNLPGTVSARVVDLGNWLFYGRQCLVFSTLAKHLMMGSSGGMYREARDRRRLRTWHDEERHLQHE